MRSDKIAAAFRLFDVDGVSPLFLRTVGRCCGCVLHAEDCVIAQRCLSGLHESYASEDRLVVTLLVSPAAEPGADRSAPLLLSCCKQDGYISYQEMLRYMTSFFEVSLYLESLEHFFLGSPPPCLLSPATAPPSPFTLPSIHPFIFDPDSPAARSFALLLRACLILTSRAVLCSLVLVAQVCFALDVNMRKRFGNTSAREVRPCLSSCWMSVRLSTLPLAFALGFARCRACCGGCLLLRPTHPCASAQGSFASVPSCA